MPSARLRNPPAVAHVQELLVGAGSGVAAWVLPYAQPSAFGVLTFACGALLFASGALGSYPSGWTGNWGE